MHVTTRLRLQLIVTPRKQCHLEIGLHSHINSQALVGLEWSHLCITTIIYGKKASKSNATLTITAPQSISLMSVVSDWYYHLRNGKKFLSLTTAHNATQDTAHSATVHVHVPYVGSHRPSSTEKKASKLP